MSGTAVGNNFCVPDPDKLQAEIASVKARSSTRRGCGKTIRIFAGLSRKGTGTQGPRSAIAAIHEAYDYAAKYGFSGVGKPRGITATAEPSRHRQGSPPRLFGVNLDTGNFHMADPYADLRRSPCMSIGEDGDFTAGKGK